MRVELSNDFNRKLGSPNSDFSLSRNAFIDMNIYIQLALIAINLGRSESLAVLNPTVLCMISLRGLSTKVSK